VGNAHNSHNGKRIVQLQTAHSGHPHSGKKPEQQEASANCIFCKALGDLVISHVLQVQQNALSSAQR